MDLIKRAHRRLVFDRRIHAIAEAIAPALHGDRRVLDIGCGSGELATLLRGAIEGLDIVGVETHPRRGAAIPVQPYDGRRLPFADDTFDASVIVDVLHHAEDPVAVLREARRVSRRAVIVKDHIRTGRCAQLVLSFMDWVGNAPHGVACCYRYFSSPDWDRLYGAAGLHLLSERRKLGLYPWPARLLFERDYHVVAVLVADDSRVAAPATVKTPHCSLVSR